MNDKYKNQRKYYWEHREQILQKHAELAKDPEYRKHRVEISMKSYYKRKEEKYANTENQI